MQTTPAPAASSGALERLADVTLLAVLRGRSAIITGGAGGLGSALARVLGEAGMRLALADVALDRARERAAALAELGVEAIALPIDVGNEHDVRELVEVVQHRFGRLDVVVNNAAIDITTPISELSGDNWQRVVNTNLTGPFLMAKHAARVMAAQGEGYIVNICSTASKRTWPNAAAYHATKWGLLGLSHALHAELRPQHIRVTAIIAGGMRTPFMLDRFPDIDVNRLQDPLDVARVVRFVLCQPPQVVLPEVMVLPVNESTWP